MYPFDQASSGGWFFRKKKEAKAQELGEEDWAIERRKGEEGSLQRERGSLHIRKRKAFGHRNEIGQMGLGVIFKSFF